MMWVYFLNLRHVNIHFHHCIYLKAYNCATGFNSIVIWQGLSAVININYYPVAMAGRLLFIIP